MSKVSFKENGIMSDQLANRSGNLSQLLFRQNEAMAKKEEPKPIASVLEETNPYEWQSVIPPQNDKSSGDNFNMFMSQSRMSTYYQDHPWEGLKHAKKYGYNGPQLGGQIRGNIPPGYFPGNTLEKPNNNIMFQMRNRNTIEGFENSVKWN